jgi:hypothetical protein
MICICVCVYLLTKTLANCITLDDSNCRDASLNTRGLQLVCVFVYMCVCVVRLSVINVNF